MTIKIIIADDQTLMRDGLQTIVQLEDDMTVAATAENGAEAYELVGVHQPDLVLMEEMVGRRTTELQEAHLQLTESLRDSAEAMTAALVMEERQRIAYTIHDTVGHTLTATIVQMEAAKRLMKIKKFLFLHLTFWFNYNKGTGLHRDQRIRDRFLTTKN
ncbi:response regulator [Paenibacillus sp. sptzw28]|uniref:histidine kinase n=1 Tax=Paenibacillus sp. sptzw28 TaxID=715179 RepID=UPI001C6E4676|nr:histidine kinase [Paenibacillus sp. sptzw28]QYR20507.1 response regulator [Paenibacillus sp. sptzw28]